MTIKEIIKLRVNTKNKLIMAKTDKGAIGISFRKTGAGSYGTSYTAYAYIFDENNKIINRGILYDNSFLDYTVTEVAYKLLDMVLDGKFELDEGKVFNFKKLILA